jgi:hypothetical protein
MCGKITYQITEICILQVAADNGIHTNSDLDMISVLVTNSDTLLLEGLLLDWP